jgi:hypothetical protein
VLVQRAGLAVEYLAVDGVDWETPDHDRAEPADPETRRHVAEAYDQDARHWAVRVQTAFAIVQEALTAGARI